MSEKLRLTLTTAAVERLIGGDTEVEMDLRQAIVAEFTRRHLGPLLNSPEFQKVVTAYNETIQAEAAKAFGELKRDKSWGPFRYELAPEVQEAIRAASLDAIKDELAKVREEVRAEVLKVREAAQERIKAQMDAVVATIRHDLYAAVNKVINDELRGVVRVQIERVLENVKVNLADPPPAQAPQNGQ